ncbi:bifunctional 4-hydroxy-2-oxoglutarate aldolase/2-dehydro-3-deoxy-phosphogluconate aldolase [Microlunatus panaciterrae]|uniref:2-dehydro-3-deoxyphosphogluconate aldolase/(4S)-4-hydroxy-2-oxoglutarate aldolase n=1 Tax=Microlunatus panaciterrae TaxID=400768 RepID=A0ABS2RR23_9ACTN|nr:2-dehydro-3-deoxyphosphogluconate aldolase [Microlunatus panaciterrae]MBM7800389.1 2-dehydro-3-deoxyphosphogluconate aldolase/(4S)-4-hydroxy-2-oxoglutarate aldolase [Microlunatus panaciterrae]
MATSLTRSDVMAIIADDGVVGIVRASDADQAVSLAQQIWAAGLSVVEIALTTPSAMSAITRLAELAVGRQVIGAGTVLDAASARLAVLSGAQLLVTPTLEEDVIEVGRRYQAATVIGCATPTEMLHATELGADAVKVFPASLWTPRVLADVLQPLPQLHCIPTGGVTPDSAASWIEAGAFAVGIGSALTRTSDPAGQAGRLREAIARARTDVHS